MSRLYGDENFSFPVVEELRRLGHDVLTAQEAGKGNRGIGDPEVLAFACGQGRAVLTFNRRHFIRLHQQAQPHRGIVVCTRDNDVVALAARIHQAIASLPDLDNQLLRINRPLTHEPGVITFIESLGRTDAWPPYDSASARPTTAAA